MPKLHLFIKGMHYDKLIITQSVHPPSLNMPTEGDVGTWDTLYFYIGWIVRNKYMKSYERNVI